MVSIARLRVVKQSSFGLPGQYGRRVTRGIEPLVVQLVIVVTNVIAGRPQYISHVNVFNESLYLVLSSASK